MNVIPELILQKNIYSCNTIMLIMLQQIFVDREKEMAFLENAFKRSEAQLLIIYGRRRVGKTELVKQFIKDKRHVYFIADERGALFNLIELKKMMAAYLEDSLFEKADIREWTELFTEFTKKVDERMIIVIDEFPYLIKSDKAVPSLFQKIWDANLSSKEIMLILLGSSISVMETQVLGYRAPLYGRRTGQWKLEPLKLGDVAEFLPYEIEELIKAYAILDGIPLYIMKFDSNMTLIDNLKTKIFTRGQFLYEEAEILLKQELREPANYFNILRAISYGRNKFGEIANFTMLDKSIVSKYVENLINLRIIEKEYPITQRKGTRNAFYKFTDNYFNFWFRFVYPNKHLIEEDRQDALIEQISEDLNKHYSRVFEDVCKDFLQVPKVKPFIFNKIGRWWHKNREIDLVALNEKTHQILFCECKWKNNVDAKKILRQLREKSLDVEWMNKSRDEYYVVFGKSFREKVYDEKTRCYDMNDIAQICKRPSASTVSVQP